MDNENIIKGNPTKQFFIEMLTRDIKLERAIIDLIDNSIDGAKNLRPNEDYDGLWIRITIDNEKFKITDNCGGFSLDTAKEFAFRFGRPQAAKNFIKHSVGRFGVGMKRALFKLGTQFIVESKSNSDHFSVEVDVNEWAKNEQNWDFNYEQLNDLDSDSTMPLNENGTEITVSRLRDNVKNEFSKNTFINNLKKEIQSTLCNSLEKNIKIYLNNDDIERKKFMFLYSDNLKPAYMERIFKKDGVAVKIYAGIGEPEPSEAGWNIFCNDRLVLESDKSSLTGWKDPSVKDPSSKEETDGLLQFHNQYAMFRGAVFFDADNPNKLPMTTTKTGIDSNHSIYISIRLEMMNFMKQIFNFLRGIKTSEERDEIEANAEEKTFSDLEEAGLTKSFIFPQVKSPDTVRYTGISYHKEKKIVTRLKKHLGVSSNKEVGEKTFDYFINMEKIGEEE